MVAYMAGGRMAFKAPNLVYWGVGEYHLDGIYRPDVGIQSDDTDYGKTLEVNLDTRTRTASFQGPPQPAGHGAGCRRADLDHRARDARR